MTKESDLYSFCYENNRVIIETRIRIALALPIAMGNVNDAIKVGVMSNE